LSTIQKSRAEHSTIVFLWIDCYLGFGYYLLWPSGLAQREYQVARSPLEISEHRVTRFGCAYCFGVDCVKLTPSPGNVMTCDRVSLVGPGNAFRVARGIAPLAGPMQLLMPQDCRRRQTENSLPVHGHVLIRQAFQSTDANLLRVTHHRCVDGGIIRSGAPCLEQLDRSLDVAAHLRVFGPLIEVSRTLLSRQIVDGGNGNDLVPSIVERHICTSSHALLAGIARRSITVGLIIIVE
jgi:hypothetical protein